MDALKSEIESWARSRRQKTFDTLKSSIDQRFPSVQIAMKVRELNIKRDLEIEYIDADGNVLSDEPIFFKFSDGTEKTSMLDSSGKATLKKVPLGPFRAKQPRRR